VERTAFTQTPDASVSVIGHRTFNIFEQFKPFGPKVFTNLDARKVKKVFADGSGEGICLNVGLLKNLTG